MKLKRFLCAVLALMMLSAAALAVQSTEVTQVNPMHPGPAMPPQFEISRRNLDRSVMVWGSVKEKGEGSLYIENSNEQANYAKIIARVGDGTVVVDAATGALKTLADIKTGETVYAWVSPAMTRSMPPQSNAAVVVCNLPADFAAPKYAQVLKVTQREDGGTDALMSGDVILHLNADTKLLCGPGFTSGTISVADIVPGTMLLSWYNQVALSLPAQAWPGQVMVFPTAYEGYVSAALGALRVNGVDVALSYNEGPFAHEGKLMVPVRKFVEALGCTALWDAAAPNTITVQKDGATRYTVDLGASEMTRAMDLPMALAAPMQASGGVSFLCLDDLLLAHNVMCEANGPWG